METVLLLLARPALCRHLHLLEARQRLRYGTAPKYEPGEEEDDHLADISFRMGELEPWIDENFVRGVWFSLGETVNVKMIRDKFSGYVTQPVKCVKHNV